MPDIVQYIDQKESLDCIDGIHEEQSAKLNKGIKLLN